MKVWISEQDYLDAIQRGQDSSRLRGLAQHIRELGGISQREVQARTGISLSVVHNILKWAEDVEAKRKTSRSLPDYETVLKLIFALNRADHAASISANDFDGWVSAHKALARASEIAADRIRLCATVIDSGRDRNRCDFVGLVEFYGVSSKTPRPLYIDHLFHGEAQVTDPIVHGARCSPALNELSGEPTYHAIRTTSTKAPTDKDQSSDARKTVLLGYEIVPPFSQVLSVAITARTAIPADQDSFVFPLYSEVVTTSLLMRLVLPKYIDPDLEFRQHLIRRTRPVQPVVKVFDVKLRAGEAKEEDFRFIDRIGHAATPSLSDYTAYEVDLYRPPSGFIYGFVSSSVHKTGAL